MYLAVPVAPGRLDTTWVSAKPLILKKKADLWHIWPYSQAPDPPHFHMHIGKTGQFFQNKGVHRHPCWIRCTWPPKYCWIPPEHPQATSSAPPARCCRLPIHPVQKMMPMLREVAMLRAMPNAMLVFEAETPALLMGGWVTGGSASRGTIFSCRTRRRFWACQRDYPNASDRVPCC